MLKTAARAGCSIRDIIQSQIGKFTTEIHSLKGYSIS